MLSHIINLAFSVSLFSLISFSRALKNIADVMKVQQLLYYYVHFLISNYLPLNLQITLKLCHQQDGLSFYTEYFLFTSEYIYLKYIKSLHSGTTVRDWHLKQYVTTYINIQIRIILSMYFGYIIGLYIVSYCVWQFSTYFEDVKVL